MFNLYYLMDVQKVRSYLMQNVPKVANSENHANQEKWIYSKPKRRLKLVINNNVVMFVIHTLIGEFWHYSKYKYNFTGEHELIRNGKYPNTFTETK